MKVIKKRFEGFVVSNDDAMYEAQNLLKNSKNGSRLILSFWNGTEMFIKSGDKVIVSTEKEWNEYFKLQSKKRKCTTTFSL